MSKADKTSRKTVGQFDLLSRRRFAPFFWTQFFGAFNDNLFKNGLMILIAYGAGNMLAAKSAFSAASTSSPCLPSSRHGPKKNSAPGSSRPTTY